MNSSETASLAREVFKMKIATECGSYAKQKNSLNTTDPALIAEFRNSTFVKEVEMKTPFLYSALQGGVKEDIDFNKIALGASSCLSTRVKSSAYLTRNTVILQHGGCKARDISRLNQLGICSSHKTSIRVQNRMGEAFDEDITEWKEDIEETKKNIRLLEEVKKALRDTFIQKGKKRFNCVVYFFYRHERKTHHDVPEQPSSVSVEPPEQSKED